MSKFINDIFLFCYENVLVFICWKVKDVLFFFSDFLFVNMVKVYD